MALNVAQTHTFNVRAAPSNPIPVTTTPTPPAALAAQGPTVIVVPVPGEPGPPGPAFEGAAWWHGEGPPGTVLGSKPGDYYMDTLTGTVYRLGD